MNISKQLAVEAFIVGVVFALTSWIALALVPGFDLMVLFAVGAWASLGIRGFWTEQGLLPRRQCLPMIVFLSRKNKREHV